MYITGGADSTIKAHNEDRLLPMINGTSVSEAGKTAAGGGKPTHPPSHKSAKGNTTSKSPHTDSSTGKGNTAKAPKSEAAKAPGKVEDLESYDYDLIVIGGGSGGLAASKVCTVI